MISFFLIACATQEPEYKKVETKDLVKNFSKNIVEVELNDPQFIDLFNLTSVIIIENNTKIFEDLSLLSKGLYLRKFDCDFNKTIKSDYVITNCHNQFHHNATILTNLIFEKLPNNVISVNPPISRIVERFQLTEFELISDRILSKNAKDYVRNNELISKNKMNDVLVILDPSNNEHINNEFDLKKNYFIFTYEQSPHFTSLIKKQNSDLEETWIKIGNHEINQDTMDAFKFNEIIKCKDCELQFFNNKGVRYGNFIYEDG